MQNQTIWKLLNPEGVVEGESVNINPHPETLEGKTVLLHWNGKHNGDVFLDRIAELLTESIHGIKIIKSSEVARNAVAISSNPDISREIAHKLASFKPDIVIGAQGD